MEYSDIDRNTSAMLENVINRLNTALDEKRELEIERLQIQKNYMRTKNEAKHLREQLYEAQKDEPTLTKANQVKLQNAVVADEKVL